MAHERTDSRNESDLLFTFAVVADSHINPAGEVSNSPWLTNRQANARSQYLVSKLNGIAPDFVIHLGDLVHPVPALPAYEDAVESFQAIYSGLKPKLHLVPGNHDVGDKPGEWLPAKSITAPFLDRYRSHFGDDFYSFDHGDCHFVVINSQLLNSGLEHESEHAHWLEQDLRTHERMRTFVFSHYPPFICSSSEIGHYDNIDEPARSWLLGLLAKHGAEALFSGHVHNFFYNRLDHVDHYIVPSVAFVRHDYSELARVAPGASQEYGRNDTDKLGFFAIQVYRKGHVARVIRTHGRTSPRIETDALSSTGWGNPVGLDARQVWTEKLQIPYSGGVDEFARKPVRNDYPLMALWDMGIKRLRIPIQDLLDDDTRSRIEELSSIGHEFQVFSYGVPNAASLPSLRKCADQVTAVEVILHPDSMEEKLVELKRVRSETGLDILLSQLQTSAASITGGDEYAHFIRHGFDPSDQSSVARLAQGANFREAVTGLCFSVSRYENTWRALSRVERFAKDEGLRATSLVRLAADSPAAGEFCDTANANIVAEAIVAGHYSDSAQVNLDTFADMDRGYFPRTGLTDRRYNLRPAGLVAKHLSAGLRHFTAPKNSLEEVTTPEGRFMRFGHCTLALPQPNQSWRSVLNSLPRSSWPNKQAVVVDLLAGATRSASDTVDEACTAPFLLVNQGSSLTVDQVPDYTRGLRSYRGVPSTDSESSR